MRAPKALLCVVAVLLAWKVVRTDWVVIAPYWFHNSDPPASDEYCPYPVPLPVSPLWHPPKADEIDPIVTTQWRDPARYPTHIKSWEEFFPGGGAGGITGPPQLQPNWPLIGLKLAGGFVVLFPTVILFGYIHRRLSGVSASTSTPNARNA